MLHVTTPQNDGAEELENTLFDLAERQFFVEDENTGLGERLWRSENHVARLLLRDHDLDWHELTGVFVVDLALQCNEFKARVQITDAEI